MWAFYDYSLTPLIKVNFIGRIKKRENFKFCRRMERII